MDNYSINILYFELTHSCNQSCKHCYLDGGVHNDISPLNTKEIIDIIDRFKKQGGSYIIITGGEASIRRDCFEILDYIEKLEIPFTFATNSLLMNRDKLNKLIDYKYLDIYFTSILGSTEERHNRITKNKGYKRVINALDYLDKKGIKTYVQVTLAKNDTHTMGQIASKLLRYKNCQIKFTPITNLGTNQNEEGKDLIVPNNQLYEFHKTLKELMVKYPNSIEASNLTDYDDVKIIIDENSDNELYSLDYGFVVIRPNGDISFSCYIDNPYTFGNAKESLDIPLNQKFFDYINLLKEAELFVLNKAKGGIIEMCVEVEIYIKNLTNNIIS